jgi:membrane protein implicated in regulation of membrane protease activity
LREARHERSGTVVTWWYWVIGGILLSVIELATPGGFFVLFFAIAAVVVGVLQLAGLVETPWVQWLLFSVLSVAGLTVFRKPLLGLMGLRPSGENEGDRDSLVGEAAVVVSSNLLPGERGRVELRGTGWNARHVGTAPLAIDQRCRVVAIHGLTLDVREE